VVDAQDTLNLVVIAGLLVLGIAAATVAASTLWTREAKRWALLAAVALLVGTAVTAFWLYIVLDLIRAADLGASLLVFGPPVFAVLSVMIAYFQMAPVFVLILMVRAMRSYDDGVQIKSAVFAGMAAVGTILPGLSVLWVLMLLPLAQRTLSEVRDLGAPGEFTPRSTSRILKVPLAAAFLLPAAMQLGQLFLLPFVELAS